MIRFSCPTCGKIHHADDSNAGAKGVCGRCGQKIRVPEPSPLPSPTSRTVVGKIEDFIPSGNLPPPLPPLSMPTVNVEPIPALPVDPGPPLKRMLNCPGCNRRIPVDDEDLRGSVQCVRCHTVFDPVSGRVQAPVAVPMPDGQPVVPRQRDSGTFGNGFGVAAMVLGIVGMVLAFFPCFFSGVPALICATLAIIFGTLGLGSRDGHGMAIAGLVLGVVAVSLWFLVLFALLDFFMSLHHR